MPKEYLELILIKYSNFPSTQQTTVCKYMTQAS